MPSEPNGPFETDTSCEPKDCVIEEKIDYYGEVIKWEIKESQQACADWCVSTEGCCFWSWNKNKDCFVKSSKDSIDSSIIFGACWDCWNVDVTVDEGD